MHVRRGIIPINLQRPNDPNTTGQTLSGDERAQFLVFEYLGCFWHGCPCMPNRHKPIGTTEETLLTRYEETNAGLEKIKNAGFTVVSIWGCDFRKLLREDPRFEN